MTDQSKPPNDIRVDPVLHDAKPALAEASSGLDERDRFGSEVSRTARQWRKAIDRHLRPHGLTEATWLPLLHLARARQPLNQKKLAAQLSLDGSSIVRLLDALQGAGLIERREGSTDRRAKAISLTPLGLETVARVEAVVRRVRQNALAGLNDRQVKEAFLVMRHVCRVLADDGDESAAA